MDKMITKKLIVNLTRMTVKIKRKKERRRVSHPQTLVHLNLCFKLRKKIEKPPLPGKTTSSKIKILIIKVPLRLLAQCRKFVRVCYLLLIKIQTY